MQDFNEARNLEFTMPGRAKAAAPILLTHSGSEIRQKGDDMKSGISRLVLAAAIAGFTAPAAFAQTADNPFLRGRHVAVTERVQPEYDPLPMRAGAFNLSPSLTLSAEHNSNILALPANEISDTVLRIRPAIDAVSTWSSHELAAGLSVERSEYDKLSSESTTNHNAYVRGNLDVMRGLRVGGQLTSARVTEPRYEAQLTGITGDPSIYDQNGAQVHAYFVRDRVQVDAAAGVVDTEFKRPDMRFRDMTETYGQARVSVAMSPDLAVYVQGRVADIDFDDNTLGNRNATRTDVKVGVNFELRAPFRGDIGVGYVKEDKDDPALNDTDGMSADGRLMWFPTQLTTVTGTVSRTLYDPGILNNPTAIDTSVGLRVDHELRRNIMIYGSAQYGDLKFEELDRDVSRTTLTGGVGYRLNRNMRLDAYFTYTTWDSFDPLITNSLDQQIVGVSLRLNP